MGRVISAFDDINREGLMETPKRYIKFLDEFLSPPDFELTDFEGEGYDEMIICKDIPFFSLCEHHLAPFFGAGTIAYIPEKRVIGLSKMPRTLEKFCRRFQNQERITCQVAEYLWKNLKPKGVAVTLQARHLCVEMRGVRKQGTQTVTTKLLGAFKDDQSTRNEYIQMIRG